VVSLSAQRAYVYRNGVRIGMSEASTGKEGHETPTGTFTILEKEKVHRSSRYNDAPMPYMQRLTWYGVALHGGPLPGYAASHGCIRLPLAFARKLFGVTSVGTQVVVTDDDAGPSPDTAPEPADPDASPEVAADGP
jgi:lipoprotein-anchoring transpeptidase ErfK/SrfK